MTEQELRNKVVSKMLGWEGAQRGDSRHAEILAIYNGHKPLARGYTVQKGDAYCATTASAAYIAAGMADFTGTECGVEPWVKIAQGLGIWIENDAHVPKPGDAVVYDWEDSGQGDNTGYSDHIGIVISVTGSSFVALEGNQSGGRTGRRSMQVNGRYIRGFICPDFAAAARALTPPEPEPDPDTPIADDVEPANEKDRLLAILGDKWIGTYRDLPDWAKAETMELIRLGALKGTEAVDVPEDTRIGATLSFVRSLIVALRAVKALAKEADKAALADALKAAAAALKPTE